MFSFFKNKEDISDTQDAYFNSRNFAEKKTNNSINANNYNNSVSDISSELIAKTINMIIAGKSDVNIIDYIERLGIKRETAQEILLIAKKDIYKAKDNMRKKEALYYLLKGLAFLLSAIILLVAKNTFDNHDIYFYITLGLFLIAGSHFTMSFLRFLSNYV